MPQRVLEIPKESSKYIRKGEVWFKLLELFLFILLICYRWDKDILWVSSLLILLWEWVCETGSLGISTNIIEIIGYKLEGSLCKWTYVL